MLKYIPKLALLLSFGIVFISCGKDNKVDPVKEANNSRIETVPPVFKAVYESMNSSSGGYYLGLPYLYDSTSKSYPLLISIHGAGQLGNGTSNLPSILFDGVPRMVTAGKFPANFEVNGNNFSFIIIAPQFVRYPANVEIDAVIQFAKKHYRVDPKRIYLTGLSMGGAVSWDAGADYHAEIAAIVPISGVPKDDDHSKAKAIADSKLPVWTFHNQNDDVTNSIVTKEYVSLINSFSPAIPPKMTIFQAEGHDAWNQASNPEYRENNMNIYEWMLQYTR